MPKKRLGVGYYGEGMVSPGTIDINNRPVVKNHDGSISTVRSMSFNDGQGEVLIPTVVGKRVVSEQEAIDHYYRTGQHLGVFETPEAATDYANHLHLQQEYRYLGGKK